jgi:hypothetical protein
MHALFNRDPCGYITQGKSWPQHPAQLRHRRPATAIPAKNTNERLGHANI